MYLVPPLILASSSICRSCNKNKNCWSNNRLQPAIVSIRSSRSNTFINPINNSIIIIINRNTSNNPNPNTKRLRSSNRLSESPLFRLRITLTRTTNRILRGEPINIEWNLKAPRSFLALHLLHLPLD